MKLEIEDHKLESTKDLILGVRQSIKHLSNRETDYIIKGLLDSCSKSLQTAYNNLDKHTNKPKPIRKMGVGIVPNK